MPWWIPALIVAWVVLAVVTTLLLQATTAGWVAGRLGLLDGPAPPTDTS
jgi:hypothetical protein